MEWVQSQYPDLWRRNESQEDPDFRWPEGESYAEFRRRSLAVLSDLAAAYPGGRILVFTHSGLVSQVIGWVKGLSPAKWSCFRPGTCSLTELSWGDRCAVVRFDDRDHVQADGVSSTNAQRRTG
jgi:broad specificity phosphatase PhoE